MAAGLELDALVWLFVFLIVLLIAPKVIWILKHLRNIQRQIKVLADTGISGPPTYPILGNMIEFHHKPDGGLYNSACRIANGWTPIVRVWVGPHLACVVKDARDIEVALNAPTISEKSVFYGVTKSAFDTGLLSLDTQTWKRHRKAIMPSFHFQILQEFVEIFHLTGKKFVEHLENHADKNEIVDVTPLCGRCANETVCRTVLSSDLDDLRQAEMVVALEKSFDILVYRLSRPWYLNDWLFAWNSSYTKDKKLQESIEHVTKEIISKKKKEFSTPSSGRLPKKLAFLDMILSTEGCVLTDDEVFSEVKTLLMTGTGSSMDALSFVMYTIAIKKDIQDKVCQELRDVFGDDQNRPVTHEELPHLEYLERVIKETLRFFPVAPYFSRSCSEDTKMPTGGTIPRGATVAFWVPHTHMDPANFPNPKEFDPDRFLPEVVRTRHQYSYIPFSGGPRNCIGQRYAMMFMKTVMATVLRRVRFVIPEGGPTTLADIPIDINLTLSVKGGARLKFERRMLN